MSCNKFQIVVQLDKLDIRCVRQKGPDMKKALCVLLAAFVSLVPVMASCGSVWSAALPLARSSFLDATLSALPEGHPVLCGYNAATGAGIVGLSADCLDELLPPYAFTVIESGFDAYGELLPGDALVSGNLPMLYIGTLSAYGLSAGAAYSSAPLVVYNGELGVTVGVIGWPGDDLEEITVEGVPVTVIQADGLALVKF